jgi:hypothetical protein
MMRSVTEKHGGFGLVVTGADRQDIAVVVRAGMIRSGRAGSGWAVLDGPDSVWSETASSGGNGRARLGLAWRGPIWRFRFGRARCDEDGQVPVGRLRTGWA